MGIWEWALAAYARPGVAQACLTLQDLHGQNVCLLLWAVWAETAEPAQLAEAADLARRWEALAAAPLRAVRRALKAPTPPVADAQREALREAVRATELRAERVLLETLQALRGRPPGGASALQALRAAAAAWGEPVPEAALAALAAALH